MAGVAQLFLDLFMWWVMTMELLVSHVVLSVVVGVAGLCGGWWLHGRLPERRTLGGQNDEGMVRELMFRLHGLSMRMAADVNEHNTMVGEVDRELAEAHGQGASVLDSLVERLITANRSVQSKLTETEGKLNELSHKMEHHASEARTDVLTGLANRRAFQEEAARCQSRFRETDQAFSLIMIDIDRFKQVNDVHGHPFGDEVLRGVGEILVDQFRGRDIVTRYGGEEFAILMPNTDIAESRRVAEGVREIIEKTRFEYSGKSLSLTISLGVAEILPYEDVSELLKRADQAMYAAKHSGRNRVYWHDGTLPHPLRLPQNRTAEHSQEDEALPVSGKFALPVATVLTAAETARASLPATSENPHGENVEHTLQASEIDMELLNNMGNKTMFCQNVHRRIAEFKRGGAPFSVVLLHVDDSEEIVRTCGEATWKLMLGVVAQAVRGRVREMDAVARYNDLTLGMVLPDALLRNAICIGERLRKTVQQTCIELDGKSYQFTVSLGIVEVEDGDEMAPLVERAREQLEQAQGSGGNRTGFLANALVAS